MVRPQGFEPCSTAWQAAILTTIRWTHGLRKSSSYENFCDVRNTIYQDLKTCHTLKNFLELVRRLGIAPFLCQ